MVEVLKFGWPSGGGVAVGVRVGMASGWFFRMRGRWILNIDRVLVGVGVGGLVDVGVAVSVLVGVGVDSDSHHSMAAAQPSISYISNLMPCWPLTRSTSVV